MKHGYFVIIPTEDPEVHCAYQCVDEQAANQLAVELVQAHGKKAVIATPVSVTSTEITVRRMIGVEVDEPDLGEQLKRLRRGEPPHGRRRAV